MITKSPYYICKVTHGKSKPCIGVICLVDYLDLHSKIIPHERVIEDKVIDYVEQFLSKRTLNNPILLFYKRFFELKQYIIQIVNGLSPDFIQIINQATYKIWEVKTLQVIMELECYFKEISKFYVADGHHRISALSAIYTTFKKDLSQHYLSFIVDEDDLNLDSFARFIRGSNINFDSLIDELKRRHSIRTVNQEDLNFEIYPYFYANDQWYQLNAKIQRDDINLFQFPIVEIDKLVTSILMSFPLQKAEILYSPSTNNIGKVTQFYKDNQCQVAIHIPKLSLLDLYNATEKGYIFPQHSTCFTPKIPDNLFIQKLRISSDY
jgi:uncharacterized protein (DUF1015 family)